MGNQGDQTKVLVGGSQDWLELKYPRHALSLGSMVCCDIGKRRCAQLGVRGPRLSFQLCHWMAQAHVSIVRKESVIRAARLRLSRVENPALTPDDHKCKLWNWLKNGEESLLLSESGLNIIKNISYESFENTVR